jgi:hypothetical protein
MLTLLYVEQFEQMHNRTVCVVGKNEQRPASR